MPDPLDFKTTMDFAYGQPAPMSPGVVRVVANNPGPFTFRGTNTYFIGAAHLAIVDPGPDDPRHIDAILAAANGRPVTHIFITHAHRDHIDGARRLKAATGATTYAFGRIVLWSAKVDATQLTLDNLTNPEFRKVAIAAPDHAPYGARAREALEHVGVWNKIQSKLVFGENITHTAQLIDTQAAEIGVVALSLAVNERLKSKGGYYLIPASFHQPLEQAYAITRYGAQNQAAKAFAAFMQTEAARKVMRHYGFLLPGDKVK